MIRLASILALTMAMASASYAEETSSTVRFSNNDALSGNVESLTTERLMWKSPALEKPVPFFLRSVMDLTLTAKEPNIDARHEAIVTLTNGDVIRGQLASLSVEAVELDTWFAGHMKINRLMISDIKISERPDYIFRGPTGLDGWKQSGDKPAWTFQNGAFRSSGTGSIARNVGLPDECTIAFTAEWRSSLNLRMAFFSNEIATDRPSSGYEIIFQRKYLYLRSSKTKMSLGNSSNVSALAENEKARIEIRASIKSGKIAIYIDGAIVDVWTDPELAGTVFGKGIHFITQNEFPVQISRIDVSGWDGQVDKVPEQAQRLNQFGNAFGEAIDHEEEPAPEPDKKPKENRMELRNGDSMTGEVLGIAGGMISVKTPFRDVKLPIESLRTINLPAADLERCKREQGDVRAWFPDGSSIVFRLEGVGEGTLSGSSQNFGTATFRTEAFNRIEFNIYDPAFEDLRMANGW